MRKVILPCLFITGAFMTNGQDMSKLFKSQDFVWCGVDFSQTKCIGSEGFTDPDAVKNKYFDDWNDLIIAEADKYNFEETYQKSNKVVDLSVVNRRNDKPEVDGLVINEAYKFDEGQLKEIIKDYNLKTEEELGLVYVVESLNKTEGHAVVYTVFFDTSSKEIIWSKRFEAAAGGFGFRNYWARSFYEVIRDSEKVYKKAMKEYEKSLK